MPDQHPTDRRLMALIDNMLAHDEAGDVRRHVADCPRCQLLIGQVQPTTPSALPNQVEEFAAVVPADGSFEERETWPQQGDVWRVAWEGVNELGVVDHVDDERQRVFLMPVLPNTSDADEWCGFTRLEVLDSAIDLAVSVALATSVPWSVLDACVGRVPDMRPLSLLRAAFKRGLEPEETVTRGLPLLSATDPRLESIQDLGDAFHALAQATWGADAIAVPRVARVPFDVLLEAGLPPNRALALSREDTPPTEDEYIMIQRVFTVDAPALANVIPMELRRELDQPRWRPLLRARMAAHGHSEADERTEVARAVQQPMAARGTHGEDLTWVEKLERILG